ncbi:acyl-peptide hydrolase [Kitasatospora sp. NE20-6]|uniref:alpha/beta hydrolase family protein n=1 Tax=Kitasatospora sp. NE20-6 TaxID=2859066 RepID=UPI0034DC8AE5
MRTAPYGTWTSPITAAEVAEGESAADWLDFVGDELWWTEARPAEAGRSALVGRTPDGEVRELLGPAWNVRSRVIEYGGRPWLALGADPTAGFVFVHWDDQRVHRASPGTPPVAVSPRPARPAGARYCDFTRVGDEIWCLREEFTGSTGTEVRRELVALPLDGSAAHARSAVRVLAATHHFMTGPRISPDGRHAAWIGWDHPAMPWDATELMCAPVTPDGGLGTPRRIAGGDGVSVGQVEWDPDRPGVLHVVADPGGWWNLHEVRLDGTSRALCPRPEEFGEPLWRIGTRWFLPLGDGRLAVTHGTADRRLAVLGADGSLRDVPSPYTEWVGLAVHGRRVAATAAGPRDPWAVVLVTVDDPEPSGAVPCAAVPSGAVPSHAAPSAPAPGAPRRGRPRAEVVRAEPLRHADHHPYGRHEVLPGPDGEEVHAFVHPPHHPGAAAPEGELPPFLVQVHGGPTTRSRLVARPEIAFFTSRGIGVVDVQYGGSTGFGRAYRERLRGHWGVTDVRDCAAVARALIARGIADPARIGIRGGSAGGWTAAASLAAEPDLYRAAGIYYPLLDPEQWRVSGTHDFESRYLESLIGPWPQARSRYEEVSPLRRAHRVRTPFVILQGTDDAVCPPEQSERYLDRLRGSGVPHAYLTFEGEQHGFRTARTVEQCLTAELSLYAHAFGFTTADAPPWDPGTPAPRHGVHGAG